MSASLGVFLTYLGSIVVTELLNKVALRMYEKDYRELAKDLGVSWEDLKKKIDEDKEIFLLQNNLFDCIIFLNILMAIRRILLRKQVTGMIRAGFTMFIPSLIDLTNDDKKEKDKSKEYFVSYYLNDRPITIWFSYDGDISILEISAETFKSLSSDEQANILMRILYEIYLGSNKYNASLNIKEVFDDNLIQNLLETFESGDTTYVVDLQKEEKELCRTRKRDK